MAKRKARKPPQPRRNGAGWHLLKMAVKSLVALALAFGVLAGTAWFGTRAGTGVASNARYTVPFADIDTAAPPGLDRQSFLMEVRYLNDLPETLQSVDPKLSEQLKAAFAKHPWVRAVDGIAVAVDGRIRVELQFREPALVLLIDPGSVPRALDRDGVLLPANAPTGNLPVLQNRPVPISLAAGQTWPDPDVRRAVELARLYPCEKIERVTGYWHLTRADGKVLRIAAP